MAKKAEHIDRTLDFWRDRRTHKYMLSDQTVGLLGKQILRLGKRKTFTLEHAHSLTLCVSLIEAQVKDCLRLTIDTPNAAIDEKSDFLDIKIDIELLQHFRSRRLSLGQFVFANTSISTVARVWTALKFCFPYMDFGKNYTEYLQAKSLTNGGGYDEMKSALARIYDLRNRFVHEFFDDLAQQLGEALNSDAFIQDLRDAFNFLTYVQGLKNDIYATEFNEDHPSRGEVSKEANAVMRNINKLTVDIQKALNQYRALDWTSHHATSLIEEFSQLNALYEDYFSSVSAFRASCASEGSMAIDFQHYNYLQEAKRYLTHLRKAKRDLSDLVVTYKAVHEDEGRTVDDDGTTN